jgi:hypothetical protein
MRDEEEKEVLIMKEIQLARTRKLSENSGYGANTFTDDEMLSMSKPVTSRVEPCCGYSHWTPTGFRNECTSRFTEWKTHTQPELTKNPEKPSVIAMLSPCESDDRRQCGICNRYQYDGDSHFDSCYAPYLKKKYNENPLNFNRPDIDHSHLRKWTSSEFIDFCFKSVLERDEHENT